MAIMEGRSLGSRQCKAGAATWKTLMLQFWTWTRILLSLVYTMVMETSHLCKLFLMVNGLSKVANVHMDKRVSEKHHSTIDHLVTLRVLMEESRLKGKDVSRFCAKHLHAQVLRNESYSKGDLGQSLQHAFLRMDEMMRGHRGWRELSMLNGDKLTKINHFIGGLMSPRVSEHKGFTGAKEADDEEWAFEQGAHSEFAGPTSGSTAVVALLQSDKIVVANAGDSRCVLGRGGKAFDLSKDHKPDLEVERDRITQAGGFIHAGRVNGSLNLARAIGDSEFKQNKYLSPDRQIVTAWPEIQIIERTEDDEFLILACDGVWDVMTSQDVVDFIHEHIQTSSSLSAVCEKLLDNCLAPTTTLGEGCDNMTIIVVQLKDLSN